MKFSSQFPWKNRILKIKYQCQFLMKILRFWKLCINFLWKFHVFPKKNLKKNIELLKSKLNAEISWKNQIFIVKTQCQIFNKNIKLLRARNFHEIYHDFGIKAQSRICIKTILAQYQFLMKKSSFWMQDFVSNFH